MPNEWLSYAKSNLRLAYLAAEDEFVRREQVCFHAQQAAEKAIKAITKAPIPDPDDRVNRQATNGAPGAIGLCPPAPRFLLTAITIYICSLRKAFIASCTAGTSALGAFSNLKMGAIILLYMV